MHLPTRGDWVFSVKTYTAAMLALYIAMLFDLPRPYWAMATVYIVSSPLAGLTSSKGLYRALGTLIGAAAAVALVPVFINAPELLCAVVALWTGGLLYVSMLDRTPRSYVAMLSAYSLPLIALPEVGNPQNIFDIAVARSEEIILGITCASIVSAVVLPGSLAPLISARIQTLLSDAATWIDEILSGLGAVPQTPIHRQKLAAEIAGIDLVVNQLAYDVTTRDAVGPTRALRGRLTMLLPLLSSLADRLHALASIDAAQSASLVRLQGNIAEWIRSQGGSDEQCAQLRREIAALRPKRRPHDWNSLMLSNALSRMRDLIDLWQDCLTLQDDLLSGRQRKTSPRYRRIVVTQLMSHDHALLAFSAASAMLASLLASGLWIASGWANGASFVMMVAVSCCFFATMDRPVPMMKTMLVWCSVSLVGAAVYLFAVLPFIHDFEMLALVFAGPFLLIGAFLPRPEFGMITMLLTVNTASFVALQNRFSVDFTVFANEGLAALCGICFALLWTLAVRPFGAELAVKRMVRANWRDIAAAASGRNRGDRRQLFGRMLDRLGQLVPKLAMSNAFDPQKIDGLADLRLGFNILDLQQRLSRFDPQGAAVIGALMAEVEALFLRKIEAGQPLEPPQSLQVLIDQALGNAALGRDARQPTEALIGMRRVLFPHAPPPVFAPAVVAASRPEILLPRAEEAMADAR